MLPWAVSALAADAPAITVELVNQRLATLQETTSGESTEAQQSYEQTRALLNTMASMNREAQSYTEALTTAPERAAAIQERLDAMGAEVDPKVELAGLSDPELATRLAAKSAEREEQANRIDALDRRLAARESNADAANKRLEEIDQRIDEIPESAESIIVDSSRAPSLAEATEWRGHAERLALVAERKALQAQLASQTVRFSALAAERVELVAINTRDTALILELQKLLADNTAAAAPSLSDISIDEAEPAYRIAKDIVEADSALYSETATLNKNLNSVRSYNDQITSLSRTVEERYATARRIVDFAGDSEVLGRVLLTYWEEIEGFSQATSASEASGEAGGTVIRRIAHEDALAEMVSASGFVNGRLKADEIDPQTVSAATMAELITLTQSHRQRLRDTIAIESEYLQALDILDTGDKDLKAQIRDYRTYLEGLVLWIPNHPPLWQLSLKSIPEEINYIAESSRDIRHSLSVFTVLLLLAAIGVWLIRNKLKTIQIERNRLITQPRNDSIRHTLVALAAAFGRAAPVPLLFLAWAASSDAGPTSARMDLTEMLMAAAMIVLTFHLLQVISEPEGVGRLHFHWRSDTMDRIHSEFTFLIRWWLPVIILAALTIRLTRATGDEIIGRSILLTALIMICYQTGLHQFRELRSMGRIWFKEPLNRFRFILSVVFVITILAIVYGQVFSVRMIIWSLLQTMWAAVALLLLHSILMRWSRVARRHLRLNELLAQRAEAASGEEKSDDEEELADLGDISAETQQLILSGTVVTGAFALVYIWAPLLPALEGLSRITLWTTTSQIDGETVSNAVTLTKLIITVAVISFTFFAAKRIPALVEMVLRSRTSVSSGARYTTSTLLNYSIIGLGLIVGLSSLGLQWDKLQWLVAALGVGIGFGLQEIVANFISGLIILFERPIRVGDIITIGDKDGKVLKIRIRATTIKDWDGKELLVPNKEFITGRLLNWTLSDSYTRLVIPVGIAYGSNVEEALRLLTEVVNNEPKVLDDPSASFFFLGFGDNSLNLEARCFLANVDDRMPTLSNLHTAINNAFNDAGIVIAFPQRDLHFDADQPLRIAFDNNPGPLNERS